MRLFVALLLSEGFKRELLEAARPLREARRDLRWEGADKLHLTIAFIGETGPDAAALVAEAAARTAADAQSFSLSAAGLRGLPRRKPHTALAAALRDGAAETAALAARFEDELEAAGANAGRGFRPRETRRFTAHVTLARAGRGGFRLSEAERDLAFEARGRVEALAVLESTLAPGGSRYAELARFDLAGHG